MGPGMFLSWRMDAHEELLLLIASYIAAERALSASHKVDIAELTKLICTLFSVTRAKAAR